MSLLEFYLDGRSHLGFTFRDGNRPDEELRSNFFILDSNAEKDAEGLKPRQGKQNNQTSN